LIFQRDSTEKHITNILGMLIPSNVRRETNTAADLLLMQPADYAGRAGGQILLPELR